MVKPALSNKATGLFNNLSPCPPSRIKGRGNVDKRGAKPLSKSSFLFEDRSLLNQGCLRGALAPLSKSFPPLLLEGEGD